MLTHPPIEESATRWVLSLRRYLPIVLTLCFGTLYEFRWNIVHR